MAGSVSRTESNIRDGDTISFNAVYSKEAIDESDRYFKTRRAYVKAGGGLAFSVGIHTLQLTLKFMTGEPETTAS